MLGAILAMTVPMSITEAMHQRTCEKKDIRQRIQDVAGVRREQRDAKRRQGHTHSQPHSGGQKFAKGGHAVYPLIRVWESAFRPAPETRLSHSNAIRHVSLNPPDLRRYFLSCL